MRIVIALVLAGLVANGCVWGGASRSPRTSANVAAECRADTATDVALALVGLGITGLGVAAELQGPPVKDFGMWLIVPGALTTITSTTSAIYGAVHGSTCKSASPPQRSGSAYAAAKL